MIGPAAASRLEGQVTEGGGTVVWMAWRTVRRHPGSVAGALVSLVVAATMVSALWFVIDSANARQAPVERYAGVPLVVGTGMVAGAIPPELVTAVRALPEVGAAVPELTFAVGGVDADGPVWGHGWSSAVLTPFRLSAGRPPRGAGEVVVDARLAGAGVGDRVALEVAGVVRTCLVVGVATAAAEPRHQTALFFADDHAATLAGRGTGGDALGVFPRPGVGTAALAAAVSRVVAPYESAGVRLATGAARGLEEGTPAGPQTGLWFLLAMTALVATGMVAAAQGLSVRRRGMEIAVLRALGARPRQIRRMLLAEGLLLSALATAIGLPLGMLAAPVVAGRFRDFGNLGAAFELGYRPAPMAWTLAFTLAVALAASLMAVARALRVRPGDALGEAPQEGRRAGRARLLSGLALLAVAAALTALLLGRVTDFGGPVGTMAAQFLMIALVVAAAGLVAPWVVLSAGRLVRAVIGRVSPVGGFLATANVIFNHRRFAGAVGAIALGMTLVGVVVGTQLFYDWRAAAWAAREVRADHVLLPAHPAAGLSEEVRRGAQERAVGVRSMPATLNGRPTDLTVATGDVTRVLDLALPHAPGAGEVALDASLAGRSGAQVGSRLRVRLPGAREDDLRTVTGIYPDTPELASMLVTTVGDGAARLGRGPYQKVYVRGALARPTPLALTKRDYVWHTAREHAARNRALPYVSVLVALFGLVAAVNGLCLALLDRGREFTGMRRLGLRRAQIARMICWESLLTVLPVLLLALAATVWTTLVHAVSEPGGPAALASFIPFDWLASLGGGALLAALAGSLLAVRAAMRNQERQGLA
ncbi:ABC transporter permease [Nonomuraea candida]|uniref:ABC transporter permease n=1 Tax=Nonomuraea candida TaxID=359159 RepID=UPI0005BC4FE0|nr:ABC transporter permease [Nonomuraea candida]